MRCLDRAFGSAGSRAFPLRGRGPERSSFARRPWTRHGAAPAARSREPLETLPRPRCHRKPLATRFCASRHRSRTRRRRLPAPEGSPPAEGLTPARTGCSVAAPATPTPASSPGSSHSRSQLSRRLAEAAPPSVNGRRGPPARGARSASRSAQSAVAAAAPHDRWPSHDLAATSALHPLPLPSSETSRQNLPVTSIPGTCASIRPSAELLVELLISPTGLETALRVQDEPRTPAPTKLRRPPEPPTPHAAPLQEAELRPPTLPPRRP